MSTGSIIIKPIEAKLERNVASFSKMNPYCIAKLGALELRGKVCKNGGTRPVWAEAFVFSLRGNEDCFLEIKDKDMITSDTTLGVCRIDIKELQEKGSINKWYKLYYKKKEVGEVELEATYTDQEYTSRVIVYPQPKRAKQPEEQPQAPQVDKTIKVREHLPRPEELAPKGENVVLNSPSIIQTNRPDSSAGLTRKQDSPQKAKSPLPQEQAKEPEVQKIEQIPAVEGNVIATTTTTVPVENAQIARPSTAPTKEKEKKKGWLSKIKGVFDTNNSQKKKSDKKDSKNDVDAPLTRKADWKTETAPSEDLTQTTTVEPILERKRPAPKTGENEVAKYTEQENLGNIRGNNLTMDNRRNFEQSEDLISKNPYSYTQSDNDYISKLREKYSTSERRPITDWTRRPDFQRDEMTEKAGVFVEDLNNEKKSEGLTRSHRAGYDDMNTDPGYSNYTRSRVDDVQDRMRYKYR